MMPMVNNKVCLMCFAAHGDIKPSNFLLYKKNDGTVVIKISDFGLSRRFDSDRSGNPVVTQLYAAPEILNGNATPVVKPVHVIMNSLLQYKQVECLNLTVRTSCYFTLPVYVACSFNFLVVNTAGKNRS